MFNSDSIFKYLNEKMNGVKSSFKRCMAGEENLNRMLWFWCLIPNIIVCFITFKLYNILNFTLLNILYLVYNLICLYFIIKAVSVHPEYNVSKVEKNKNEEYVKSLSKDDLKNYKKELTKKKTKELFEKALLVKPWRKVEFYKLVRLILIFILLVTFRNLFK